MTPFQLVKESFRCCQKYYFLNLDTPSPTERKKYSFWHLILLSLGCVERGLLQDRAFEILVPMHIKYMYVYSEFPLIWTPEPLKWGHTLSARSKSGQIRRSPQYLNVYPKFCLWLYDWLMTNKNWGGVFWKPIDSSWYGHTRSLMILIWVWWPILGGGFDNVRFIPTYYLYM